MRFYTKNKVEQGGFEKVKALNESVMRIESPHDQLLQKPRIDLGRISGKNLFAKGLIKLAREFAKLVTETNSKV